MSDVEFRLLGPADAMMLQRVADEVFDEPVVPERVATYLSEPGHLMIAAFDDGVVVGQVAAVIHRHPDKVSELYVDEVGVAPSHQRRGIASRMMEMMFEEGRRRGCGEAWLGTEAGNLAARALYERYGVEPEPFVMYVFDLALPVRPARTSPKGQRRRS